MVVICCDIGHLVAWLGILGSVSYSHAEHKPEPMRTTMLGYCARIQPFCPGPADSNGLG